MIRVTIEIVPFGREEGARKLRILEIANMGGGDKDLHRYKWRMWTDDKDGTEIPSTWTTGGSPNCQGLKFRDKGWIQHLRIDGVETLVKKALQSGGW